MGKKGADKRWGSRVETEEEKEQRAYFDRKDEYYGTFERKDGVVVVFHHSTNRRDQLDVYINGVFTQRVSKRTVGELIFELV